MVKEIIKSYYNEKDQEICCTISETRKNNISKK